MNELSLFDVTPENPVTGTAVISPCQTYRYSLTRTWDATLPTVTFIGLNPSTADGTLNDPTIRRCIGFARGYGYGRLLMVNLFAFRSTEPQALVTAPAPVGPDNDNAIRDAASRSQRIILCWGAQAFLRSRELPKLYQRDEAVLRVLAPYADRVFCLRRTQSGAPQHPLYLRADTVAIPYIESQENIRGNKL